MTPAGYRALTEDAASYLDPSRRVLSVTGDRAPAMLQGLVTADITEPGDGAAWPTLVLSPKGRVLADAVIVRAGDLVLLDVPEAGWTALETHFARYLPPRFAGLEPTDLSVLRVRGPKAIAAAVAASGGALAGIEPPVVSDTGGERRHAIRFEEGAAARVAGPGGGGLDVYLSQGEAAAGGLAALTRASDEAWDAWRVERGIPVYGWDVTEDNLPQETGLVPATTSFTKGCYTGQEVLARIHYRGKVNRRLVGLRRTGGRDGPPLEAGQRLLAGERDVGTVTSATRSPRLGWIALGYARREVEEGSQVLVAPSAGTARVVELPFVPAGG